MTLLYYPFEIALFARLTPRPFHEIFADRDSDRPCRVNGDAIGICSRRLFEYGVHPVVIQRAGDHFWGDLGAGFNKSVFEAEHLQKR